MKTNELSSNEVHTLGRYTVFWVNVTDWYASRVKLKKKTDIKSVSSKADMSERSAHTEKAKSENKKKEKKKDGHAKKLEDIVGEASNVLAEAKTLFPFQMFTDEIIIDRHKLTLIFRSSFNSAKKVSVPIEDIKNVQSSTGPVVGSLTITSDHFVNNTQTINNLKKKDVEVIQKLIQGAVIATKEEVDISKIEPKKLRNLLCELGEGKTPEP
ncbi:MAG TPA: hypothetical protein VFN51_02495 [Candidatus Saccharimonadales bacterium]|nr:hypothetical protein [Candidatus Saccharimonadales bacterium]